VCFQIERVCGIGYGVNYTPPLANIYVVQVSFYSMPKLSCHFIVTHLGSLVSNGSCHCEGGCLELDVQGAPVDGIAPGGGIRVVTA